MNRGLGHKRPLMRRPERAAELVAPTAHDPAPPAEWRSTLDLNPALSGVVAITGSASNAGKTWLTERLLEACRAAGRPSYALKVTRTHVGSCPRENDGCGVCDSLARDYEFMTEAASLDVPKKDTGRYLAAGADQVGWLLVKPRAFGKALDEVLPTLPAGHLLVAEGNSFRDWSSAEITLMAVTDRFEMKASAAAILDRVDAFVAGPETALPDLQSLLGEAARGKPWIPAAEAAAWVLARLPVR